MHCLYGLQQLDYTFQLKGGTSLSKGHKIISRFSEDIDILIEPPAGQHVMRGKNHDKPAHRQSRKDFFDDWLKPSKSTALRRSSAIPRLTMCLVTAAAASG
jgi:predicted nucleotidyltransferase component of viral defense system